MHTPLRTDLRTLLLGTDSLGSPTLRLDSAMSHRINYTPFGHTRREGVGFAGQMREKVTGGYILGNGYRSYLPTLLRFSSGDSYSPFREGGLNMYAYGVGNPVNYADPTGHSPLKLLSGLLLLGGLGTTGAGAVLTSRQDEETGVPLIMTGIALTVLGSIGVFFPFAKGRARLSRHARRQREFFEQYSRPPHNSNSSNNSYPDFGARSFSQNTRTGHMPGSRQTHMPPPRANDTFVHLAEEPSWINSSRLKDSLQDQARHLWSLQNEGRATAENIRALEILKRKAQATARL